VRETVLRTGGLGRDRWTRVGIALALGATVAFSLAISANASSRFAAGVRAAGVAVMWLGLLLRVWAIVTLGRSFRTTVVVDADQAVIRRGPYARIRHPSYTGLLVFLAGLGVACGSWWSVAAGLLIPLPAFVYRIRVEEAELTRVLGPAYRDYAAATARLIPGVW
jgi:protein-S-isoprenylcysteine O-methyltransferase Ste14